MVMPEDKGTMHTLEEDERVHTVEEDGMVHTAATCDLYMPSV